MKVFTIGFTKKSAEDFFNALKRPGLKRIVDVRLNNVSQLAGFSKRDDLRFFAKTIGGLDYVHLLDLAPTQKILDEYRKSHGSWADYESSFNSLMAERQIESRVSKDLIEGGCLLCSEDKPRNCHRRLVAEYLQKKWGGLEIEHII
ncbi:MAG: DUF488 domain-containing protein [Candidatus Sulfotelmatobacter sp.]